MDEKTNLKDLKTLVYNFNVERKWQKYHTPHNIASSICIESAELLQIFQWYSFGKYRLLKNKKLLNKIKEEVADIVIYALSLANTLNIDISEAVKNKLKINAKKYPVKKWLGKAYVKF